MNISESTQERQSISLPRQQFLALSIVDMLGDIEDHLENGRTFSALHAVRDLAAYVETSHAEELALIANMPPLPLHVIDSALHAKRKQVLEKQSEIGELQFRWTDAGTFELMTVDGDVVVTVHPNDNWISHTCGGDNCIVGIGLTALLAHLSPETLCEKSHALAKWAARQHGVE